MSPVAMTTLLAVTIGAFAWSMERRWRLIRIGEPEPSFSWDFVQLRARVKDTLVYAIGQKRMPKYPIAGFAHILIFFGFLILLLRTLMLWGRGYDLDFDFWGI